MDVDRELRAAADRLRDHTADATPDVAEVVRRGQSRQRRTTMAATLVGFVVVLATVAGVATQRDAIDAGIDVFGDGGNTEQVVPPAVPAATSTTSAPKTTRPHALSASNAIGGGAPCDAAAFGEVVSGHRNEPVLAVERFACINNWAAARVSTASAASTVYIFHIEDRQWVTVWADVERDARALEAVGAPIDSLYRIMGLTRSPLATTTTQPGLSLAIVSVDDAQQPPADLLARITRQFIADIGEATAHETLGTSIRVFDGYLLSSTTMRLLDDADRDAIRGALSDAGFAVEFIPYVDPTSPEVPTLVFADPSIHRDPVDAEPGTFAVYGEISGCGQACGYGADYLGRPDGNGGWLVTPVVDAGEDPPVTPSTTVPEATTEVPTVPSTTTIEPPEGPSGAPTAGAPTEVEPPLDG